MSETDDTVTNRNTEITGSELRQAGSAFLRYVEDNPLAAVAGALVVGVILVRFAFLGNPKD